MYLRLLSLFPIILVASVIQVHSYKILGLFLHPGKSHMIFFEPLLKALAEKGHEITVVSYFPQKNPIINYRDISPKSSVFRFTPRYHFEMFDGSFLKILTSSPFRLLETSNVACKEFFTDDDFRKLLKLNETFDIILHEYFFSDCLLALNYKFKKPIVGLSSGPIMPWVLDLFGNPYNPSYIPTSNLNGLNYPLNFMGRMKNTVLIVYQNLVYNLLIKPMDEFYGKELFGKNFSGVEWNTTLFLLNSHFSITVPRPLVPAVIEVNGLHLRKSAPLPKIYRSFTI